MIKSSSNDRAYHRAEDRAIDLNEVRIMQDHMKIPELEDAVVNVACSLGSNGRGKGGVGGHMFAIASQHPKRFAPLLERALRLKKSARPNEDYEWRGGERILNREQALEYCKEKGLPETLLKYLVRPRKLLPLDDGPPSSARDFLDAIIAAARRHGSNGRGKDGVEGYILMLARIGCRTFDRWVIRTMIEQVEARYRGHELSDQEVAEIEASMREDGVDPAMLQKELEAHFAPEEELDDDEIEDPWGVGAKGGIRRVPSMEPDPARAWNSTHPSPRLWQRPGRAWQPR
jgi:hypothetical protein